MRWIIGILCILGCSTCLEASYGPGEEYDDEAALFSNIRGRSPLARYTTENFIASKVKPRHGEYPITPPKVTSAIPCDFFNFTDRTCWLYRTVGSNLLLRLRLEDENLRKDELRVYWKRKYKIRNQNLYAVEDISQKLSDDTFQQDILALELKPLRDRDMYLNKIQALVYILRKQTSGRTNPLFYGDLTYIIDMNPENVPHQEIAAGKPISIKKHFQFPDEDFIVDWKRQLSRVRYVDLPKQMEVLLDGKMVQVKDPEAVDRMTIACIVYNKDGRFYAKRSFLLTGKGKHKHVQFKSVPTAARVVDATAASPVEQFTRQPDSASADDQNDYQVDMFVHVNKLGNDGNYDSDYTLIQTNVSVMDGKKNFQVSAPIPSNRVGSQGNKMMKSELCFHLIQDSSGRTTMVPCDGKVKMAPVRPTARQRPPQLRKFEENTWSLLRSDADKIETCQSDAECSIHASCKLSSRKESGRCVCNPGYLGNGLFCWEQFFA